MRKLSWCHGEENLASSCWSELAMPSAKACAELWAHIPSVSQELSAVTLLSLSPQVPGPGGLGPCLLPQEGQWRAVPTEAGLGLLGSLQCPGAGWHLQAAGAGQQGQGRAGGPEGWETREPPPAWGRHPTQ